MRRVCSGLVRFFGMGRNFYLDDLVLAPAETDIARLCVCLGVVTIDEPAEPIAAVLLGVSLGSFPRFDSECLAGGVPVSEASDVEDFYDISKFDDPHGSTIAWK